MFDPQKAERKKEKRIARIMGRSIGAVGIGVGLFVLRFLVAPFLGHNDAAIQALTTFSLCLIGFGATMIVVFIFKRDFLPKAYLITFWVILPVILLKFLVAMS